MQKNESTLLDPTPHHPAFIINGFAGKEEKK
jgi:hypothetical protein